MEGIQLSFPPEARVWMAGPGLYTKNILASGSGGAQKSSQVLTTEGQGKVKRQKAAVCFAWKYGRTCAATPCRYVHSCSHCGGCRIVLLLPWMDNIGLLALSEL